MGTDITEIIPTMESRYKNSPTIANYKLKRIELFGCKVDNLTMSQTLYLIGQSIESNVPLHHVVVNVSKIVAARKDPQLEQIINGCDIINCDGMPLYWASKLLKKPLVERVTGIDLMENLVGLAYSRKFKIFFLGAKEEEVNKVVENYKSLYGADVIAGYRNGYFSPEEAAEVINQIALSKADILFVAIPSPQKELFLEKLKHTIQIPFIMGVGGSFDVVSGLVKRAPLWVQKIGMEWFFRFLQEPKRLWKRYLVSNTQFMAMFFKEAFNLYFLKAK